METKTEQRPAAETAPQATAPLAERRRFLRGTSLALPAVVTLHSGTARAATSLGCGGEGNVAQDGYIVLTDLDHQDERLRASVELYRLVQLKSGGTSNNPADWEIVTSDTGAYFLGEDGGAQVWRRLDGSLVETDELAALQSLASDASIKTGTFKFAIVHVSTSDGTVTAVGAPDAQPGSIVTSFTGACMASLYGVSPV